MTYKWQNEDLTRRHHRFDAELTRDYINGERGLSVAFAWFSTPMGHDFWAELGDVKYGDLPDEARAYVDAVAALYPEGEK